MAIFHMSHVKSIEREALLGDDSIIVLSDHDRCSFRASVAGPQHKQFTREHVQLL